MRRLKRFWGESSDAHRLSARQPRYGGGDGAAGYTRLFKRRAAAARGTAGGSDLLESARDCVRTSQQFCLGKGLRVPFNRLRGRVPQQSI
jgi:hypothetical protein